MKSLRFCLAIIVLIGAAAAQAETTRPSATSPAAASTTEQTMNQLLSPAKSGNTLPPATSGPVTDATSGKAAVAPGAPSVNVLREGTFIVNRVGRLSRGGDAQQMEFTFDSDGKAMKDPPLLILPNLKLMQMESAVTSSSRDLRSRVSGMITEYKSRNYILLDKVVVVPDVDQQF